MEKRKAKSKLTTLRMSEETWKQLQSAAARECRSTSNLIDAILRGWLESNGARSRKKAAAAPAAPAVVPADAAFFE